MTLVQTGAAVNTILLTVVYQFVCRKGLRGCWG